MSTRITYPLEVKEKAIQMKLEGKTTKEILETLNIKNKTQVETWWRWYRNGETHRFRQPVGKQYTFGKGPEILSELDELKLENRFLTQQLEVLKKYAELERMWKQQYL